MQLLKFKLGPNVSGQPLILFLKASFRVQHSICPKIKSQTRSETSTYLCKVLIDADIIST